MVRKLYIDSRARKAGTHGDFIWQPDRPILVEKCRAFIDSVHLPNVCGSITATNQYIYVTEQQANFTVLANQNKIYLSETSGGNEIERILSLSAGVYTEATLATQLQVHLGAAYAVTSSTGQLNITSSGLTSWKIFSRAELQTKTSFSGQNISPTNLQDACDLMGTTMQSILGVSGNVYLGLSKLYRRVAIPQGQYSFTELATALQTALNTGSTLPQAFNTSTYVVSADATTGKLKITNASTLLFEIFSEQYLTHQPNAFSGYSSPWFASDHATGFTSLGVIQGNNVTAEQHVNTMRHHTVFINSDLGTHNNSIGPLSQTTIARKVVIDQPYGAMVNDYHSLPFDYISLDKQSISAMRFRLTDWMGHSVDMPLGWSLSIIFVPEEEF